MTIKELEHGEIRGAHFGTIAPKLAPEIIFQSQAKADLAPEA